MIHGRDPGGGASLGGAARFVADLEAWVATAQADAGVEGRRRERWLRTQAEEEATVVGVLADLAERQQAVAVTTRAGRRHRGTVRLVGRDFALLATEQGSTVLVRIEAIAQIRSEPGTDPVTGDRQLILEVAWADALRVLAADRTHVLAVPSGGPPALGELRGVGADVVALRLDGDGSRAYLPVGSIDEVVVDDATLGTSFD